MAKVHIGEDGHIIRIERDADIGRFAPPPDAVGVIDYRESEVDHLIEHQDWFRYLGGKLQRQPERRPAPVSKDEVIPDPEPEDQQGEEA